MESANILPAAGIITLTYHRVNNTDTDPWNICVSPENFEAQIKFLNHNFNVISVPDLVKQVTTKRITKDSVCISFDDGYADNFIHAKPILERYNCPAAFFIASGFINQAKSFWWDELEIIFLHTKQLPACLCLIINNNEYNYCIEETELSEEQWKKHENWKWFENAPTSRCKVFLDIWTKLRSLELRKIRELVLTIRNWAAVNDFSFIDRAPMNKQQLKELSLHKLFTIGLHTHTHIDLTGKQKFVQQQEISTCKNYLSKLNIQANMLAYPYGRFDDNSIEAVTAFNLDACFTTKAGKIYTDSDLHKLNRWQVCNWDVTGLEKHLNTWMNDEQSAKDIIDSL